MPIRTACPGCQKLLAKGDRDYLFVASRPPAQVSKGAMYTYAVQARSRKGGVKFKLESGPKGMNVTPAGQLTWAVPADFAEAQVNVILSVTDGSGQEIFHTFGIAVK